MSLEEIAKEVVINHGKDVTYAHIWDVMHRHGLRDESGDLADRVFEMVKTAEVRVKVRFY